MKTVYYVVSKKKMEMREGNNDESNNFKMVIIDEGVLDKALTVHEGILNRETPWKTIYEVINDEYFKHHVDFLKSS